MARSKISELKSALDGATLRIQREFFSWLSKATGGRISPRDAREGALQVTQETLDDMIALWSQYADLEIPVQAAEAERQILRAIRRGAVDPSRVSLRAIQAIIDDTKNKFTAAAAGGYNRIKTLLSRDPAEIASILNTDLAGRSIRFRITKQIGVSEDRINAAISSAIGDGSRATQPLLESLLRDTRSLIEGRVLVITRSGRSQYWSPSSYAEVVARTRGREAQSVAAIRTMNDLGQDLIKISDHNTDTEICKEFEGHIYSLSGTDPRYPRATSFPPYHPNCLHSILPHIESVTPSAASDRLETRDERDARAQ